MISVNSAAIFQDENSWVGGNLQGDITLVEFVDYRCGYCRKAHDEVAQLVQSDGNIRFILKEFPILGDQSVISSRFAIATRMVAGDAAYKSVHDALIAFKGTVGPESLARLAADLGLDAAPILAKMDSDEVTAVIRDTHQLAARLQINGTPTFVLGEQMLRGYVPLDGMKKLVAEIRAQ
jgi:protein-disulfide isomerase